MAWQPGQAYSDDLRQRVLAAAGSSRLVAARFGVSVSYVINARQRRDRSGETSARRQGSRRTPILTPLYPFSYPCGRWPPRPAHRMEPGSPAQRRKHAAECGQVHVIANSHVLAATQLDLNQTCCASRRCWRQYPLRARARNTSGHALAAALNASSRLGPAMRIARGSRLRTVLEGSK